MFPCRSLLIAASALVLASVACSSDDGVASTPNGDVVARSSDDDRESRASSATSSTASTSTPSSPSPSPSPPPPKRCDLAGRPPETEGDVLVWSDEFSGTSLDRSKWYVHDGYGGHGTILNSFSRGAATVSDGLLHITASATPSDLVHPYTSGRIDTFGRFARTYGKVEFRARFPAAEGVWYAIWARPFSGALPEIDFEILGNNAAQAWFVNHWALPPLPAAERRKYVTVATDVTQFHVYAIVWTPTSLQWLLDGELYMESTTLGVPTDPISWTINGWVGGWGATKAAPAVPVAFDVDWVRAYRVDGVMGDPTIRVLNGQAEYAQSDVIDVEVANFDEACFHVDVYEGATWLANVRPWPYRFPLAGLAKGPHVLTFRATDGGRPPVDATLPIEVR